MGNSFGILTPSEKFPELSTGDLHPTRSRPCWAYCNGAGGRVGFEINASRAGLLMRDVLAIKNHGLLMRAIFAIIVSVYLAYVGMTADLDLGALKHYRGDWMIGGSRKQLAASRLVDDGGALQLHFGYQAHFNCVRQTWHMRYDAATNKYFAKITGKSTDTAIGFWDEQGKVMTWTIDDPTDSGGPRAKPLGPRRIVHRFDERSLHWSATDIEPDGSELKWLKLRWDVIVPYVEPEP